MVNGLRRQEAALELLYIIHLNACKRSSSSFRLCVCVCTRGCVFKHPQRMFALGKPSEKQLKAFSAPHKQSHKMLLSAHCHAVWWIKKLTRSFSLTTSQKVKSLCCCNNLNLTSPSCAGADRWLMLNAHIPSHTRAVPSRHSGHSLTSIKTGNISVGSLWWINQSVKQTYTQETGAFLLCETNSQFAVWLASGNKTMLVRISKR